MARDTSDAAANGGDNTINDRVQELTWALVDREIKDDEMQLLDSLLLSDDAARATYIDCMQLHTDLALHFAESSAQAGSAKTPVVGFLGEVLPPTGVQSPASEPNLARDDVLYRWAQTSLGYHVRRRRHRGDS